MAMTYQIAAVGDWESVMGFRALGLDTYPVDVISRYKDEIRPAIILIPGRQGSLGIGRNNIQRAIERAVGADIL